MTYTYFSENSNSLVKTGLLYYDGEHKDFNGNSWNITPEDIIQIVDNTNNYIEGAEIPVFKEHNKTIDNKVGSINDYLEAREITEQDALLDRKLKPLIGKYGIFCDNIEIKDESLIDKINKGIGKSISIGIDFANNIIKELSFVGLPALSGATVFKSNSNLTNFNSGITLDEVLMSKEQIEENREEGHDLLDGLYEVINNINTLSDEELQGQSRDMLYNEALQRFMELIPNALPLIPSVDEMQSQNEMMYQYQMQPNSMRQYSRRLDNLTNFYQFPWQKKEEKKKSLLGTAAKVGATAVGLGTAGLLGKRAIGKGIQAYKTGIANNMGRSAALGSAMKIGKKQLSKDIKTPIETIKTAGSEIIDSLQNKFKKPKIQKPKSLSLTGI